ncbi:PREDICTED: leucine-rich repeat receptor protein kinase EMS1-like [Nelumbo nucifera]|uniref:Leucine-rich repeat receptor protein kinase EMS1-like n=2 Tax=Nelumbo nucifera TaxID=4432 RepID=A0A1U8Q2W9_NELNU|nr:PREDICTED: leucine-rich repeat receptor protein kinase EMS1-like [Nelumbo nucifera]DAD19309.1 TPA_asm: hypothetical protein HUJ06_020772 [Nelumbo nucifera]
MWLQNQKSLFGLDISSSGISDTVPQWFWNQISRVSYLNLSNNQLHGKLPELSLQLASLVYIDLGSNRFEGPLPKFSAKLITLDMSGNLFSGTWAILCEIGSENSLSYLDLSENLLFGKLPDCWMYWPKLEVLILNNNSLSGEIPGSVGSLTMFKSLHLRSNNFSGELPSALKNCTQLATAELGQNSFIR